jgi:hypothetical protein
VIPRFNVDIDPEIPSEAAFWMPDPDDLASDDGIGYFHNTWNLGEVTREEALEVIEQERTILDLVELLAIGVQEYEQVCSAMEHNDPTALPEGFSQRVGSDAIMETAGDPIFSEPNFGCLEFGVAGLSFALAAVGCVPAASCRSHFEKHSWSYCPVVYLAADRNRAAWLQPLVERAGCGFGIDEERPEFLLIMAPSIRQTAELAQLILATTAPAGGEGPAADCQGRLW